MSLKLPIRLQVVKSDPLVKLEKEQTHRLRSLGVIWIGLIDPSSLRSCRDFARECFCFGSGSSDPPLDRSRNESVTTVDSSVPLMHHDRSDLGSPILIQVMPKERTFKKQTNKAEFHFSSTSKGNDTCFEIERSSRNWGRKITVLDCAEGNTTIPGL